jgi:hypothetical protein
MQLDEIDLELVKLSDKQKKSMAMMKENQDHVFAHISSLKKEEKQRIFNSIKEIFNKEIERQSQVIELWGNFRKAFDKVSGRNKFKN